MAAASTSTQEVEPIIVDLDDDDEPEMEPPKTTDKAEEVVEILDEDEDVIDLIKDAPGSSKCINYDCQGGVDMLKPPEFCLSYYRVKNKENKKFEVCRKCYDISLNYYDNMVDVLTKGGKLAEVDVPFRNELVGIDDSDEENENAEEEEKLNDEDMKLLSKEFDDIVLDAIHKYDIKKQRDEVLNQIRIRSDRVKQNVTEILTELKDYQKKVDGLSKNLYSQFRVQFEELPAIEIVDGKIPKTTVIRTIIPPVSGNRGPKPQTYANTKPVSRTTSTSTAPEQVDFSKRPVLPPKGPVVRDNLIVGQTYFLARNMPYGSWIKGTLADVINPSGMNNVTSVSGRMFIFNYQKSNATVRKCVSGKEIAYLTPASVLLEVGNRIIAAFKDITLPKNRRDQFYPGIIAEAPTPVNNYRYLIFFDDGYSQYVAPELVHLIYEVSKNVWDDINEQSRPFFKKYLECYPNRPMVRLQKGQEILTEYAGKWITALVKDIDCSLAHISFESYKRTEWIYRGSTRLNLLYQEEMAAQNKKRHNTAARSTKVMPKPGGTVPYVQYTRNELEEQQPQQRAVARKSTAKVITNAVPAKQLLNEQPPSKIVFYTPRKQRPSLDQYKPHTCSSQCKNHMLTSLDKVRTYAPLDKPLLCGFHRLVLRIKGLKKIFYKGPCGKTLRNMEELHKYLRTIKSDMTVDLFDFDYWIRPLAEFKVDLDVTLLADMSNGVEDIPIQMINYVNNEKQEFTQYSKSRMPQKGVNLNLDPDFLVCCDCEDDCADKSKCACWQLTLEPKKYYKEHDLQNMGYNYRKLTDPVPTGIYECNSRCKCASTCLNRVVQFGLRHKLQVFRTQNKGWGIRCLHDIPEGSFICCYAGLLLTDEMANQSGKQYGDEYYAELDYIECTESFKEGYEAEVVEPPRPQKPDDSDSEEYEEYVPGMEDRDFVPSTIIPKSKDGSNMRTRLRQQKPDKKDEENNTKSNTNSSSSNDNGNTKDKDEDETVMISDDEDTNRETLNFNATQVDAGNDENNIKSVRDLFGENESSVYIMDAKTTGNIGRFLNHSCSPNIFVQNVFVDTHDPRFPWVAFFASNYIRAGYELTWSYNYDIGSVPGKVLYCYCNANECKGRLL